MRLGRNLLSLDGMAEPRYVPPNSMVELCHRTLGGRRLILPTTALTLLLLGVLGRALSLFPVRLHAFIYLSNHAHLLLSVTAANALAAFECHLKTNTALAIKRFVHWDGPVWTRSEPVCVLDDIASIRRLRYIMSNAVKEGLVDAPLEWAGASAAEALLTGQPIPATWQPRNQQTGARGDHLTPSPCPIELAPLPCWANLNVEDRGAKVLALFDGIVAETRLERGGVPSLGMHRVLAADPFEVVELEETPPPICHTSDPRLRAEFIVKEAEFRAEYRSSSKRHRSEPPAVTFPLNAFPPSPAFRAG